MSPVCSGMVSFGDGEEAGGRRMVMRERAMQRTMKMRRPSDDLAETTTPRVQTSATRRRRAEATAMSTHVPSGFHGKICTCDERRSEAQLSEVRHH